MASSARLNLPLLAVGQAQKEVTVNEALQLLEMVTQPLCIGGPENTPALSPEVGESFLCGPNPEGAWSEHANALALWTDSGWRFVSAFDGMEVVSTTDGLRWRYRGGQWVSGVIQCNEIKVADVKVVGARAAAIPSPQGGAVIDVEVRNTVLAILTALRTHGLIAA